MNRDMPAQFLVSKRKSRSPRVGRKIREFYLTARPLVVNAARV